METPEQTKTLGNTKFDNFTYVQPSALDTSFGN